MDEDKPPSSLRHTITDRIYHVSSVRRDARRREMAFIQHLPSPFIGSRFRNDLVILETV